MTQPRVRAHPEDGRIAQRMRLGGGHLGPDLDRWVCVTAPGGHLQLNVLEDVDIADWVPIALPNSGHQARNPTSDYAVEYCGPQPEQRGTIERWWFFICRACPPIRGKVLLRTFTDKAERGQWITDHQESTGHADAWTAMHMMPFTDPDQVLANLDRVWGWYLETVVAQQEGAT